MSNIKISETNGIKYAFMTCPHCKHNFMSWETTLSGGYIQQIGFIDSYHMSDGKEVWVEGSEGDRQNGDWTADHYCENCGKDITDFIVEAFCEE